MQLTLYVPGLLLPDAIRNDTVFDLIAPSFSLLLGRGRRQAITPDWLPSVFGLASPLAAAALRKVGSGDTAHGTWLCLDPVHFQVAREGITLGEPAALALSEAEAGALIDAIQPLFSDWGEITASTPACWELHLSQPLALETQALPDAIGQSLDPGLPGGADGRTWRRLIAEAQTVLHAHPINRQRETHGKPTVSSLWPWGLGALPTAIQANFAVAWSTDPVVAGLCAHAGFPCLSPPERFQPASGRVLASVDALAAPAKARDVLTWREALLAFEQNWLAPALAALKKRRCRELRLIATRADGNPAACGFTLNRSDLWRFWRRPQPLTALAESA